MAGKAATVASLRLPVLGRCVCCALRKRAKVRLSLQSAHSRLRAGTCVWTHGIARQCANVSQMIQQPKVTLYPATGSPRGAVHRGPTLHTALTAQRLHAGEETRVRTSSLPQRTAHPGRALVAAVRPQSRPSRPQALHHLVTAAALMVRTTRQQEEGRAMESAARVDGEAALSQRPPTALLHASTADRHLSDLNSCRLAGRTAAAQRMTMRSFVLPPSRWRGWAGPYWGPWAAKGHASRTLAAHSPHTGSVRCV